MTQMVPPPVPTVPTSYMIRRKVFKLFGGAFHVFDSMGNVVGYSKMKAFKLKEDIRLYSGEDMQREVLAIQARSIIDFGASYDVYDPATGEKVGALRRKGMKSILRDEWLILDASDREIGKIQEDSMLMALLRRFLGSLFMPQRFTVSQGDAPVALFRQNFNPFVFKLNVQLLAEAVHSLDRRLIMAGAILLSAIEGRQQD